MSTRKNQDARFARLVDGLDYDGLQLVGLAMDAVVSVPEAEFISAWLSETAYRLPWMLDVALAHEVRS